MQPSGTPALILTTASLVHTIKWALMITCINLVWCSETHPVYHGSSSSPHKFAHLESGYQPYGTSSLDSSKSNPNQYHSNNIPQKYLNRNQSTNKSPSNEQSVNVYSYGDWTSGSMNNVTATVGRNATFECVFLNLKQDFWLVWFHIHKGRHTLLASHDSVITKNGRISVRSHANSTFYLTIHDIQKEDRGYYMCQVNTTPMRSQTGYLEVNVPPSFIEEETSSDMNIRENSTVSFHCSANGRPKPEISWRREDGQPIIVQTDNKLASLRKNFPKELKEEYLNISNVSRHHMGAYLCIASNGILPTISKRIFLGVSFAPVIRANKESIGASLKSSIMLECFVESYPRANIYWNKDDQMPPIMHSDKKYEINIKESSVPYRFVAKLKILNIQKTDFGKYKCVAKNSLGEVSTSIRLYEVERRINVYNTRPKNVFRERFTTKRPVIITENDIEDKSNKVTENWIRATTETEASDYPTNYISTELNNEFVNDGYSAGHNPLPTCLFSTWYILLISILYYLPR